MSLTMESVLALAPDEASAKAARGLTAPAKWPLLGANELAAWGECQGSGAKPYQTQVDLSGPAFKCSCPSRKFPCKHGLALLMMRAQDAARFTATESPAWVSEWLASRTERAEKKDEREREATQRAEARAARGEPGDGAEGGEAGEVGAIDTASVDALSKRESQRWHRIESASQELQRWLGDQVTQGLGALDANAIQGWRTMAARMVDAQAPGLGQRLLAAAACWRQGADWPERLLSRFGLLQLATDAIARRQALPAAVQADLRTLCGWPLEQADVMVSGERVEDRWAVLAQVIEERDGRLMERRVWLQGERTGRRAWLLDHAHGGRGFAGLWSPGTAVSGTLAYFPGASPLRALVVQRSDEGHVLSVEAMAVAPDQLSTASAWPPDGTANAQASPPSTEATSSLLPSSSPSSSSFNDTVTGPSPITATGAAPAHPWEPEWQAMAHRIAAHPWIQLHPLVLTQATLVVADTGSHLVAGDQSLPLVLSEQDRWPLLAVSGGQALTVMGEWDGDQFKPLTAWADHHAAPVWTRSPT
ncbi:SWIM zinc finger family protein [Roseateles amylovorans]|uniref:SWIM zinc finger family protein n=1 Tax=Roseateles amylovorans TaxID=2978473 RepID=A0ABY6B213_9BURK|nr:SWIM zinc finger family protein [Roseateles amylovorans]UXH79441.1 SWIM zinc finger family protein [Roseateles amylovorans]